MNAPAVLHVTSHVARDLIQSSAVFEHERLVVWEYISNGLDYVDANVKPVVKVVVDNKKKTIKCSDNGRGMDLAGLRNYFTMHGENLDRKNKRRVRGFFGTGKSAAFGIANLLRITSVRDGKESIVELRRSEVEAASSGEPIPVRILQHEKSTSAANGTVVEIEQVSLKHIDTASIIEFVERHLARWNKDATVFINTHECEYREPSISEVFEFKTEGAFKETLGDATLTIKVAKSPLDEEEQGVAVLSHGVWYESTLAGSERKEQANLIFGDIDVPGLGDEGSSDIPAFDLSRKMKLNKSNPLVQKIHAFVGLHVEKVRLTLVEREKARKNSERAKALEREASKIAEIINQDFDSYKDKLKIQQAKLAGSVDNRASSIKAKDADTAVLEEGGDIKAAIEQLGGSSTDEGPGVRVGRTNVEPTGNRSGSGLTADERGTVGAKTIPAKEAKSPRTGGFNVSFNNAGIEALRASYESSSRTIWINLDHPQLRAAHEAGSIEDVKFRRLAYEVAFTEYSIGLVHELNEVNFYLDVQDAIYDVRETLNRVSRAAAMLYSE